MTNKRILWAPALVLFVTGCTDNMDTITRELRNCNNEAIDAMMMITSEQQAGRMTTRVLKPLSERYKSIEYKLKAWESNRNSKKETIEETFNSNGFYLYIAELEVNKQRYALEKTRLRNLYAQYQKRKLEEMRAEGDSDPVIIDPHKECPNLYELVMNENILKTIENQLMKPNLEQLVSRFPDWGRKIDAYPQLFKEFEKRRQSIKPNNIRLVY